MYLGYIPVIFFYLYGISQIFFSCLYSRKNLHTIPVIYFFDFWIFFLLLDFVLLLVLLSAHVKRKRGLPYAKLCIFLLKIVVVKHFLLHYFIFLLVFNNFLLVLVKRTKRYFLIIKIKLYF